MASRENYDRHDGTPHLRKLTKALSEAVDKLPNPATAKQRGVLREFALRLRDKDIPAVQYDVYRFWCEQAYADLMKKRAEPR